MTDSDMGVVLLVDDDPEQTAMYREWLSGYEIRSATSAAALDALDSTVDIVVLRDSLADADTDTLAETIRAREETYLTVLVSESDPGLERIEIGFDAYVSTLDDAEVFRTAVDRLYDQRTLDGDMRELYSLKARRGALDAAFDQEALEGSDAYQTLVERIESHGTAVDDALGDLESDAAFVDAVKEVDEEPAETDSTVEAMSEDDVPPVDAYTESESAEEAAEELLEE